jgi:outer membrane protein TolC
MSRQVVPIWSLTMIAVVVFTGCHPTHPFYLYEDGDLSHFLDHATDIEHPDVHAEPLLEASQSKPPLTVLHPNFDNYWDLSLEEAVSLAMHNSKVVRSVINPGTSLITSAVGSFGGALSSSDSILTNPNFVTTIYDPALQETDPNTGVEAALSAFDAQVAASLFVDQRDRPRNLDSSSFFTNLDYQKIVTSQLELSKTTAPGSRVAVRTLHQHDNLQSSAPNQPLSSFWTVGYEMEARHPLMRGSGVQVNRIPTIVARIRTDIALTTFEANVRDMVFDVESAYWELYFSYRALDAEKQGRDSALATWKKINALHPTLPGGEADKLAQAQQQYFEFQSRVQASQGELFKGENRLRFLMGLAVADSRLIRPVDEPTTAQVSFDWHDILGESLSRNVELRGQKWRLKQAEMELIASRNNLLPQLDVVGLYRWIGMGDDLTTGNRQGVNFANRGSTAYGELSEGDYQEFRFGVEMGFPVGFRRELSGVRNSQLQVARSKAVLEEMELEASHRLASSIQNLSGNYVLTQTNFNTLVAAYQEVEAVQEAYKANTVTLDLLLDAQRRRSQAERSYFRALTSYNESIAQVHFSKGSLLEYNNIRLAEGPWPDKAYRDAHGHARRRDASVYIDYGFTRPKVISRGTFPQKEKSTSGKPADPQATTLFDWGSLGLDRKQPKQEVTAQSAPFNWDSLGLDRKQPKQEVTAQSAPFNWGSLGLDREQPKQEVTTQDAPFDWGSLGLGGEPPIQEATAEIEPKNE